MLYYNTERYNGVVDLINRMCRNLHTIAKTKSAASCTIFEDFCKQIFNIKYSNIELPPNSTEPVEMYMKI